MAIEEKNWLPWDRYFPDQELTDAEKDAGYVNLNTLGFSVGLLALSHLADMARAQESGGGVESGGILTGYSTAGLMEAMVRYGSTAVERTLGRDEAIRWWKMCVFDKLVRVLGEKYPEVASLHVWKDKSPGGPGVSEVPAPQDGGDGLHPKPGR